MRLQTVTLRAALILLISGSAFAQSRTHSPDHLLARLSYSGGGVVDWRHEQGNPQICFALYRSGYYRVSRLTKGGTETSKEHCPRIKSQVSAVCWRISIFNPVEVLLLAMARTCLWQKLFERAKPHITSGLILTTSVRSRVRP